MSHKSFWDSLGDTISFLIFIKYGLPILIVFIIGLVLWRKWAISQYIEVTVEITDKWTTAT